MKMVMDVVEELVLSVLVSVLLAVFVVRLVSSAPALHVDVRKPDVCKADKVVGTVEVVGRAEKVGPDDNEAVEGEKVGVLEERGIELEVEVAELKEEEGGGVSSDVKDEDLGVKGAIFEPIGSDVVPEQGADHDVVGVEDDEWEGIEKSDLQDRFDCLSRFAASSAGEARLGSASGNVLLQLYALHKVATEGPCFEPPPLFLKSSTRAKWNAWQKLGTINPEAAMEQYIMLLTESIPELDEIIHKEDNSPPPIELKSNAERELEVNSNAILYDGNDLVDPMKFLNQYGQ